MTEILPLYNEDGSEQLSFFNSWRGELPQTIENSENTGNVDTPISPTGSLIPLFLTDVEFTEMLSALYVGAEFAYPEKYLQIIWNLLKAVQLPVTMPEECMEWPPYSTFITYPLQNPYTSPDLIPSGYLMPPMTLVTAENQEDYPSNAIGDIVVNFGAITFDADWFESLDGQLPTILISVQGEGQANIRLLNQGQGGLAVVTLDNPPNLLDILAGIITGADNIIDVQLDNISFPPETAVEHIFPLEITGEGVHTIYIVFLPIIDDSLIPLRFGGGFRGVELCGFQETPTMGIQDVKFVINETENRYELQKLEAGIWSTVELGGDVGTFWSNTWDKVGDAWQFAYDLMQTTYHYSPIEGADVGFTPDSPLKLYIDAGDVPFDPSALEAAIAAAQADADAAQSTANTANATANGAVSVNTTQANQITAIQGVNTTQGNQISVLTGDVVNLYARMTQAENDIGALAFGGIWAWLHDFTLGQQGYVLGSEGSYSAGIGFRSNSNGLEISYNTEQIRQNQIGWLQCTVVYNSAPTGTSLWSVNGQNQALFQYSGVGVESYGWYQLPPSTNTNLAIDFTGSGDFYLTKLRYLGKGTNLPFD